MGQKKVGFLPPSGRFLQLEGQMPPSPRRFVFSIGGTGFPVGGFENPVGGFGKAIGGFVFQLIEPQQLTISSPNSQPKRITPILSKDRRHLSNAKANPSAFLWPLLSVCTIFACKNNQALCH
ncbi:MAG: hypothetical protein SPK03_07530 [Alloprevotella sp.]|nr:hypothetical protein [Alloprevotella sp.]